jgi:hypothetical protein
MEAMGHGQWIECVDTAAAWLEMFGANPVRVRLCQRMLNTRVASVIGRTVSTVRYGWKLAGGT